jgi:hypothetical protein
MKEKTVNMDDYRITGIEYVNGREREIRANEYIDIFIDMDINSLILTHLKGANIIPLSSILQIIYRKKCK